MTPRSLILLHGALGNAATMHSLATAVGNRYQVFIPDLPGHGTNKAREEAITIESLAHALHSFIHDNALQRPIVFGYSLGGYVALYHALRYPDVIGRVITFATKYHWNPEEAAKQVRMLNAEAIEEKVPAFARILKDRHGDTHWKEVLSKTAYLMQRLGEHPLLTPQNAGTILIPVCISVGSEDQMVTQDESMRIATSLPNAEYRVLEGLPHAIEKIDGQRLIELIDFESRIKNQGNL